MPNVTVLGAGGSTVTIVLSSVQNAAAAQTALNFVSTQIANKIVDVQVWSGSGTLPSPTNLLGSGVVTIAGNVGALDAAYFSAQVNAKGNTTLVGATRPNSTVVAGDGSNLTFGNVATTSQVFFGDSNSALINFKGTANLAVGTGNYVVLTDTGATTNVTGGNALFVTSDIAGKSGTTNINTGSTNASVIAQGSSTVPVNINATSGTLFLQSLGTSAAIINPGAAKVTVFGGTFDTTTKTFNTNGGKVTLFGGTGSSTVINGQGAFTGGTAGNNLMFTSTVAGSATLTGGGTGDRLFGMGKGDLFIAGAGSSTISARNPGAADNTFIVGNGFTTVFGAGQGGNTYLFSGLGSGLIDGRDETASGKAFQNTYAEFGTNGGGFHLIGDFVTGTDKLLIGANMTAAVTFFTAGQGSSPFGVVAGTQVKLSSGTTYSFFDTNSDGKQDIFQSDILKIL